MLLLNITTIEQVRVFLSTYFSFSHRTRFLPRFYPNFFCVAVPRFRAFFVPWEGLRSWEGPFRSSRCDVSHVLRVVGGSSLGFSFDPSISISIYYHPFGSRVTQLFGRELSSTVVIGSKGVRRRWICVPRERNAQFRIYISLPISYLSLSTWIRFYSRSELQSNKLSVFLRSFIIDSQSSPQVSRPRPASSEPLFARELEEEFHRCALPTADPFLAECIGGGHGG